jgi:ABC-type branched-subunit amino acid transport system ATPase component
MAAEVVAGAAVARPQIRVERVAKSYSGRTVVDVDELVLGDQPIEGLIGPNGAGKTTLMRMIVHAVPLDRGTITLRSPTQPELLLSSMPTEQIARHGVVKSNQLITDFERLTILDSLLFAVTESAYEAPHQLFSERTVFERHRDEIERLLDYFGLTDRTAFAMSAGEKKLLDIIRCLILRPRFLLLDEPTAGLPDDVTEKVMDALRELAAAGSTVVIVAHDLNVIWKLCDEVVFMAEGKALLRGDPQSIREHRTIVEKYLGEGHV